MEEKPEYTKPSLNLSITNLEDMTLMATDLAKFIKEQHLFQNIQGKEYVNVEAWQYAGTRLQLVPRCTALLNISTEEEIKYQATVEIWNMAENKLVGQGYGTCSNKESGKKYYQEFAIASMAQTRGVGKAYRLMLAFLIRMAGFEPTPAEEMDYAGNEPNKAPQGTKQTKQGNTKPQASNEPQQAPETANTGNIQYASAKKKEEIIRLLNNPVILREEKTKMLLNINKFDEKRAAEAIEKLKKTIEDREDG